MAKGFQSPESLTVVGGSTSKMAHSKMAVGKIPHHMGLSSQCASYLPQSNKERDPREQGGSHSALYDLVSEAAVTSTLICSLEADHYVQPTLKRRTITLHTSNRHVSNSVVFLFSLTTAFFLPLGLRCSLTVPPKSCPVGCLGLLEVPWALRSCFILSFQI